MDRNNRQFCSGTRPYQCYELTPYSEKASELKKLVFDTMSDSETQITRIECVRNVFLERAFEIRLAELKICHSYGYCPVESLIHATAVQNVHSILRSNLNWRLTTRNKYGVGVSFSDSAQYANKHCNNRKRDARAFIVCDVIIGQRKRIKFDNHADVPPNGVDTYQSYNQRVIVKFDDFMFVPKYVIYYNSPQIVRPLANERHDTSQTGVRSSVESVKPRPILRRSDEPHSMVTTQIHRNYALRQLQQPTSRIQNPPIQNYRVPATNLYEQIERPASQEGWCAIL